ncbi:hypothetical protein ACFYYH_27870 [Streptomyces sp. NPDC002018]
MPGADGDGGDFAGEGDFAGDDDFGGGGEDEDGDGVADMCERPP